MCSTVPHLVAHPGSGGVHPGAREGDYLAPLDPHSQFNIVHFVVGVPARAPCFIPHTFARTHRMACLSVTRSVGDTLIRKSRPPAPQRSSRFSPFRSKARAFLRTSSNRSSSPWLTPRQPATTLSAHSRYSRFLLGDQPAGGLWVMSRTLLILSAKDVKHQKPGDPLKNRPEATDHLIVHNA